MLPLFANLAQVVRDSAEAAIQRYCVVSNIFDDRQPHPLFITRVTVTVTLCTCKFQIVEDVGYYNQNLFKALIDKSRGLLIDNQLKTYRDNYMGKVLHT